jgi:hypothetical protein
MEHDRLRHAALRRGLGQTTGGEVDYRIIWATSDDGPPTDVVRTGRRAIEAVLEAAGSKVTWAEVFDDRRRPVARKACGRQGLTGFPSAAGWGHVCAACRTLAGQTYRFARPHPGLRPQSPTSGAPEFLCHHCGAGMGIEDPASTAPAAWAVLRWPDMTSWDPAGARRKVPDDAHSSAR